jgi:hypothetical protein
MKQPMPELSPNFPNSEPSDPESVVLALETAQALWLRQDRVEAVRWIRRAAENAAEAGEDARAVVLARAAADLMSQTKMRSEPPRPLDEAAALAPYDDFNEKTIVDFPATTIARQSMQSGVQISELVSRRTPSYRPATESSGASAGTRRPTGERTARSRQALRVAVQPSKDGGATFVVQVLGEDVAPASGAKLALLVALDPDTDLTR